MEHINTFKSLPWTQSSFNFDDEDKDRARCVFKNICAPVTER